MKSLVAEDDATNRELLKTFLSRFGECDVVTGGKQAVEAVMASQQGDRGYDLVCMDLRLPEMDGQEAMREIRKHEKEFAVVKATKIIVTTSHTDANSITTSVMARCNAYLVKPISIPKLNAELKKLGLLT